MNLTSRAIQLLSVAALVFSSGCGLPNLVVGKRNVSALPTSLVYSASPEAAAHLNTILGTRKSGLWAAGERGVLLHSEDDGRHWQKRDTGVIEFLGMDESESGTLFLAGREGLILRSADFGSNWSRVESGTSAGLFSIKWTAAAVVAVSDDGLVNRSEDDGRKWKRIPIDESKALRSVVGTRDGRYFYVAGDSGKIYRSTDAGRTWGQVISQSKAFYSLFLSTSGDLVVAVGDSGSIVTSDDYGEHWRQQPTGVTAQLIAITGSPDGQHIWAAGEGGVVLVSADRAMTWTRQFVPGNLSFRGMTYSTAGTVLAAGFRGRILRTNKDGVFEQALGKQYRMNGLLQTKTLGLIGFGPGGTVVTSRDGAKTWQQHNLPTDAELKAAAESGVGLLWIVGTHGVLASSRDGSNWSLASGLPDTVLKGVAVSEDGKFVIAGGEKGIILHSADGGQTWSQLANSSIGDINAVAIVGKSAYFAGSHRTILASNLAVSKVEVRTTGPLPTLRALLAEPGGKLWAFGDDATILEGQNGNTQFRVQSTGDRDDLFAGACLNGCKQVGAFGANGTVASHTQAEGRWDFYSKTRFDLRSATAAPDGTVFVLGSDFAVYHMRDFDSELDPREVGSAIDGLVLPDGTLIAVGDSIWVSKDGGERWQKQSKYANFYGVAANLSGTRIWAVTSDGMVLESEDSGGQWKVAQTGQNTLFQVRVIADKVWVMGDSGTLAWSPVASDSWSPVITPIEDEEAIADLTGDPEGREFWAACTGGKILHSADGGKTWKVQKPGTTSDFSGITVLHDYPQSVIAVGKGGTIATSRDAGRHWVINTPTTNDLFAVTQLPRTRQVWAVGDNGILLVSDDEGESWNIITTSGTENTLYALSYAPDGDKVYAFGGYAFQIFTPFWERSPVRSVELTRSLTGLRAVLEMPTLPISPEPTFDVRAVRVKELSVANRIQIPVKLTTPSAGTHRWQLDFDLGSLNPHPGEAFDVETCVTQTGYVRCIPLPEVTAVPWVDYEKHKGVFATAGGIAAAGAVLTILLFTYPLAILAIYRRAFVYEAVGKSGIPGAELIKVLLSGTLVPFFAFQRRTLNSWSMKHQAAFRTKWQEDLRKSGLAPRREGSEDAEAQAGAPQGLREEFRYVPLPVETDEGVIDQPTPSRMLTFFEEDGLIEIVGPGGIGKTTLLKQLASWMFDNQPRIGKRRFSMPLFVEQHRDDLAEYLSRKLKSICGEEITTEFAREMVKRGVIVPFIDGLSELELKFREKLSKEIEQLSIANMVISTREIFHFGAAAVKPLRPKPLDSKTLPEFVIRLLADLPEELSSRNTMELQYELNIRVARLLPTGSVNAPLTPLLVRLIIARAVALLREERSLDELPDSIGEAYIDYVQQLVRAAEVPDRALALEVIKALAKASTGERFTPGRFNLQRSLDAIDAGTEESRLAAVERLIAAGLLNKESVGLQNVCQFALDPVAEFCSAYAYAEECGSDMTRWRELRDKLGRTEDSATGFRSALVAVIRAYSPKGVCTDRALGLFTDESSH